MNVENISEKPEIKKVMCESCGAEISLKIIYHGTGTVKEFLPLDGARRAKKNPYSNEYSFSRSYGRNFYFCEKCVPIIEARNEEIRAKQERKRIVIEEARRIQQEAFGRIIEQERIKKENYQKSLWIEFYCKNGTTKRIEGIKQARIDWHWISIRALDGTQFSGHEETFHTNLQQDDWDDKENLPKYIWPEAAKRNWK